MLLSVLDNDGEMREINKRVYRKHMEDCERVEEMIIKGCERVIVKILLRERNHE